LTKKTDDMSTADICQELAGAIEEMVNLISALASNLTDEEWKRFKKIDDKNLDLLAWSTDSVEATAKALRQLADENDKKE
jgi:HAMP domain-containing protein